MKTASHTSELVSCIVPVCNGERYLREAISSILSQDYEPLEVIVVDDGSTDGSAEVARAFGEKVRLLSQGNAGQAAAVNTGMAAARGESLAFLDADDLWHEDKLSRQVARLAEDESLDYCVTHIQNFLSPDVVVSERKRPAEMDRVFVGNVGPTLLARRRVFDKIGLFDVSLRHAHDTEWFARARARGVRHAVLPEVLVRRRIHLDNRSQRLAQTSRAEYLHLVKGLLDQRRGAATGGPES